MGKEISLKFVACARWLWLIPVFVLLVFSASVFSSEPGGLPVAKRGLFCDSSGNIGIGTRAPQARLDVKGALLVDGNATITGYFNYRQRDCRKVKLGPDGAMCGEGYYAAGVWGRLSGETDAGGVVCCR